MKENDDLNKKTEEFIKNITPEYFIQQQKEIKINFQFILQTINYLNQQLITQKLSLKTDEEVNQFLKDNIPMGTQ